MEDVAIERCSDTKELGIKRIRGKMFHERQTID